MDENTNQDMNPAQGFDPFSPPPLPKERRVVYEYYRLDIGPDGCPMRKMPDGRLVFHPILIPYLVADHLNRYKSTGDRASLEYAAFVMDCALKRADSNREEILFTYDPKDGLTSIPHAFFSALTQSWYVSALSRLEKIFPGNYGDALRRVFLSLMIPIEDGGVLLKKDFGWIVEEYPNEPPLYTLNGWMTTLRWILDCQDVLRSNGIEYENFIKNNLDALEYLLPLYDAKFCWNSRYQLTGFTRIKFVTDRVVDIDCVSMVTEISGENPISANLSPGEKKNRWESYLERKEGKIIQFNIIQSMISFPKENKYHLKIRSGEKCRIKIFMADGEYSHSLSAMPTQRWREVSCVDISEGENYISGKIPYDDRNMFAYPTNFKKKIGGTYYNAYHIVHIVDLAALYRYTGRPLFSDVARKWLDYMENWKDMAEISSPEISKTGHLYGDNLRNIVEKYLAKPANYI